MEAMGEIVNRAGAKRAAFFIANDAFGQGFINSVENAFVNHDIQYIGFFAHNPYETHDPIDCIPSIDSELLRLKEAGAKVIAYNGHYDEGQLAFWRAMKLGMIGNPGSYENSVQWITNADNCYKGALYDCPLEECKNDLAQMREAMVGKMCTKALFKVDPEYYTNEWLPATKKELLTDEEIEISGFDDWDTNFNPRTGYSYDTVQFSARIIHAYCEKYVDDGTFATYADCIEEVPKLGEELLEMVPLVQFEGATGHFQMDYKMDRLMTQSLFQCNGTDYEELATWQPEALRVGDEPALHFTKEPFYASGDGTEPVTVMMRSIPSVSNTIFTIIIIICGLVSLSVGVASWRLGNESKGNSFFSLTVINKCLGFGFLYLFAQISSAQLSISVGDDKILLSLFLNYFGHFPAIIVGAGISSRLYRFYRVTHNRKMKSMKFSKYHETKIIVIMILICLPAILFRMWTNSTNIDGDGNLFNKKYLLQDEDPNLCFELTQPVFDLFNDDTQYLNMIHVFWEQFAVFLGIILVITLARMISNDQMNAKANIKLNKEVLTLCYCMAGAAVISFFQLLYYILSHVLHMADDDKSLEDGDHSAHVGFENGENRATLSKLQTIVLVQVAQALSVWFALTFTIFYLRIKDHIIFFFHTKAGKTTTMSLSTMSTSSVGTQKRTIKYGLSPDMTTRLNMLTTLGGANGFGTGTFGATIDEEDDESEIVEDTPAVLLQKNESKYAASTSITKRSTTDNTELPIGSQLSIGTNSRVIQSPCGFQNPKTSSKMDSSLILVSGAKKKTFSTVSSGINSTLRVSNGTSTIGTQDGAVNHTASIGNLSQVTSADTRRRISNITRFNGKEFKAELKKMSEVELTKLVEKLNVEARTQASTVFSLHSNLSRLDNELSREVFKLEVILVKAHRLNFNVARARTNTVSPSTASI
eukprot:TRINITY_DN1303_c1_g1_i1.p1 TRINITY_DN1303_c1_g1~~TRINITY_DN1303_c1_g1_i1.p1  ORF type:complete len:930 (+),score=232.47 TRINITY_DN1303_c1_g1_i1:109-2898(+)